LFSLIKNEREKQYVPLLEKAFCEKVKVFRRPQKPWTLKNILRTGFSLQPFLVVRNFSSSTKKAIAQELSANKYDLIHVETFYAMPHIPPTNIPVVLVDQTIEYQVYQHYAHRTAPFFLRPFLSIDIIKLKYWERYYWRQASKVIAVSERDKEEMLKLEPALDVDIVPNGINLEFFKKKINRQSKHPIILFVGNFYWLQNTEAAQLLIDKIFPLVKEKIPQARVMIAGQHQPQSLINKADRDIIIKNLKEDDGEGIKTAYKEATVFVSPIKGPGGTRLKNLAAMASNLPLVSTSVGMSGLNVKNGQHAFIQDTPRQMAQAIIKTIQNPKRAKKMASAARKFVEDNYDYKIIAEKLSKIYQSLKNE